MHILQKTMRFHKNIYADKLRDKGYAESTVKAYVRSLELFEDWSVKKNSTSDMQLAFQYIKHIKTKSTKLATINGAIQPIRIYFNLFKRENPFEPFILNRTSDKIKRSNFSKDDLERMYQKFPECTLTQLRDKVLLGLYVFQGIRSCEVKDIKVTDINLESYQITLTGNPKVNPRRLMVNVKQVIVLNQYLSNGRTKMLNGRLDDRLIVTSKSKNNFQSIIESLTKKLKKSTNGFINFNDIRASVIQYWVKEYDLRKAQYMAGHRYISSTEKFVTEDISKLQEEVLKYFPLG